MRFIKILLPVFTAIIIAVIFFSSCNLNFLKGGGSFAHFSSLPSIEEDIHNERQISKSEFFYVNVKAAKSVRENDLLDYLIYSREEGIGEGCKISVNQESDEDMYCMLDVLEGDLLYQDIELEYNVPKNICNYLEFELPWHYNQRVGRGPAKISSCADEISEKEYFYNMESLTWPATILPSCEEGTAADCTSGTISCNSEGKAVCSSGGEVYCNAGRPTTPSCSEGGGTPQQTCSDGTPSITCSGGGSAEQSTCSEGTIKCSSINHRDNYCAAENKPVCPCPLAAANKVRVEDRSDLCFDEKGASLDKTDIGLGNGCFGGYTLKKYSSGEEGYTSSEEEGEWGNDFSKVIGGLARVDIEQGTNEQEESNFVASDEEGKINLNKAPKSIVMSALNGTTKTYTIPHIRSYIRASDIRKTSNIKNRQEFFKSAGTASCWGDRRGYRGCKTEDDGWPEKLYENSGGGSYGVLERSGNLVLVEYINKEDILIPGLIGHPFITWACLDRGLEVKHRIHLIIREWNTSEEFIKFKESEGRTGDANDSGDEGRSCLYYNPDDWLVPEPLCNDLEDVEDLDNNEDELADGYPHIRYENVSR